MSQKDKQNILVAFVTINAYAFLAASGRLYQFSEIIANMLNWEIKPVFVGVAVICTVATLIICMPTLICMFKFIFPKRR